jgi:hypothetical protein
MQRKNVIKWAEKYNKDLKATDDRFNYIVVAHCLDETSQHVFDRAFVHNIFNTNELEQGKEEYYCVVFSEHHEPQIFHSSEYVVRQFHITPIIAKII